MRRSILASAAILTLAGAAVADDTQVIVGFKTGADAGLLEKHGGTADATLGRIKAVAGRIPAGKIASLRAEPSVAYVEEDGIAEASAKPGGGGGGKPAPAQPAETTPWGITRVGAPVSGNTGTGIHVAIIDTGIDLNHPDLDANLGSGANFVNSGNPPEDDNGHGTHVAGTVGAEDNDIGVVGVASTATLHPVKVLDRRGSGFWSAIAAGVSWSASNGMQIANMSLGGPYSLTMDNACANAEAAGVLLVVAAGNSGDGSVATSEIEYPAALSSCLAVGATSSSDALASFSSTGSFLYLAAPGVAVNSTYKGDTYKSLNGTSMATPHVSGLAALLWGVLSSPTNDSVKDELKARAQDAGASGFDNGYGWGIAHY